MYMNAYKHFVNTHPCRKQFTRRAIILSFKFELAEMCDDDGGAPKRIYEYVLCENNFHLIVFPKYKLLTYYKTLYMCNALTGSRVVHHKVN